MNEQEITAKRLRELALRAYDRNYTTFSDFLNIDEISILKSQNLASQYELYAGYDLGERCVAGFGDNIEKSQFPIMCIKISPLQMKFADNLSHRDFLGSLMNLGINRNTLGDIVIENNIGYLFCLDTIGNYIVDNLTRIRHTSVKCEIITETPNFSSKIPKEKEIIVSSLRLDAVIAGVYKLSRNNASQLIRAENVYINSRLTTKESVLLKDGDIVSVRGNGKFIYNCQIKSTKKSRNIISIGIYQ
jgi:RNA-binding protein YlmH